MVLRPLRPERRKPDCEGILSLSLEAGRPKEATVKIALAIEGLDGAPDRSLTDVEFSFVLNLAVD
jgi:hypothetical protein